MQKQKVCWFPSKSNFSKKNFKKSKKTYNFMVPLYGWGLFVSKLQIYYKETVFSVSLISRSFCYLFDWLRKDQSLSQLGVAQGFETRTPRLAIQHSDHHAIACLVRVVGAIYNFWTINCCFYNHQLLHKLQPGVFSQASTTASCQLEYFLWL